MTEAEWDACTDPQTMLAFIRDNASERKMRLFSVACCRCIPFGKDERFYQAVEVAELFADGETTKAALKRARQAVRAARHGLPANDVKVHGEWSIYWLAEVAASENAYGGVCDEMHRLAEQGILDLPASTRSSVCSLLRCIFGPLPFRPVVLDPSCVTPAVLGLASYIYEERAFERLPDLAAVLEERGCTDADLLGHCREPGPHTRGCWYLDLLLDKS